MIWALSILALLGAVAAEAQSVAGFSNYYVLGYEEHVWNMMNRVRLGQGAGAFPTPNRMNSVISATSTAANQVVYYDHWEDGFEANLAPNNINPAQPTTLVLGDGNNANGRVCDWSSDPRVFPCTGVASHDDALYPGLAMSFDSDRGMTGTCAPAHPAPPSVAQLTCSVPVGPRGTSIRFDGGDRIFNVGGALSTAHIQDPGTPLIGGGTELLPRELVENAVSYSVPVGENLYPGANNAFVSNLYVALNLVAFDDDTQVTVTSPGGGGTASFTLHRGQHWSSCVTFVVGAPGSCSTGAISGPPPPIGFPENRVTSAALAITTNSSTKVATTAPLNGMMFTGGTAEYQTRHYAMLPDILHTTDYVVTAPGENTGVEGTRALNLYIYNPHPTATITLTTLDSVGPSTFTIPPNSVRDYRNAVGRFVPNESTVRLTSNSNFWGVSAYGISNNISDWGHAWLGTRFLTNDYTLAYSPGTQFVPVASITRAGTTATVTTGIAHFLNVGDRVRISGADQAAYNGDQTITAVTANTFTYTVAGFPPQPATGIITSVGICQGGATFPCNSYNRNPVWVAGVQANTQVLVDFDNDDLFDFIDFDSNGCPDSGEITQSVGVCQAPPVVAGCTAPAVNTCGYRIGAPAAGTRDSLRIWDYTDMNNAGTRVLASRPVALSWGQDVDQGLGSDPSPDNGYTVYPSIAIDTVIGVEKTVQPGRVPLAGGAATYTIRLFAGSYGPLSSVTVSDLLPAGIACGQYQASSTLITYPDFSTGTNDPVCAPSGARNRLTWALSPDSISVSQEITISYVINIPANGSSRSLVNDVAVKGELGTSIFRARDNATLAQTDINLAKAVTDDGTPQVGEVLTYTLVLTNGPNVEPGSIGTPIVITDPIPPFTTANLPLPAAPAGWTVTFDAGQNAAVWTRTSNLAANAVVNFTFGVTINPGTPTLSVIPNTANYSSSTVSNLDSNTVITTILGPVIEGSKIGPAGPLHPNEIAPFEVLVANTGVSNADGISITDDLAASNMTYVPGTLSYSLNGGAYISLTDAVDADGGSITGTVLSFTLLSPASVPPGGEVRLRFQARVNLGTGGLFATNQANVSATGQNPRDTNLIQIPIVGNATITGHVFLDINGDGDQDAGEPNLPNVTVVVTDSQGNIQYVTTDAAGNYTVVVPPGSTNLNVDETDPDFPTGATLTTGNDPQSPVALANATVASGNVGYQPPPVTITKASSAGGTVVPGQVVTYTVTLNNNTGITQTGLRITDAVPANTTYVPGSASVAYPSGNAFRVTEYLINSGFTGLTSTRTLTQPLSPDYFVIIQGSDVPSGGGAPDTTPAQNYAALTADPFGTGDLGNTGNASQITLTRGGDFNNWQGVMTVVECISDCDVNGFRLRSAERVAMAGTGTTGTDSTSTTPWNNLAQVALIGGFNGAGCDTTAETDILDHMSCHARLFPTGTNTINWARQAAGGGLEAATNTVMVVEWGSNWQVQRVNVTGNLGGDALDAAGEYNTAAISPVIRANTWVWGTGNTSGREIDRSAEAAIITLGDGQNLNPTENVVAVGTEVNGISKNFDVYVMSHRQLATDWDKKGDNALANQGTNSAPAGQRMAISYNGSAGFNNDYPTPMVAASYSTNTNIQLVRRRTGQNFPAWVQGINFNAVSGAASVTCLNSYPPVGLNCTAPNINPNIVDPASTFTLPSGQLMTATFQVTVNTPLPGGVTQIDNTAVADTAQSPTDVNASTTDLVVRPAVKVEPNNAGFATPNSTFTFTQGVRNLGTLADSFTVTLNSEEGWRVELIDPATGAVIAIDTNGDGTWDGGFQVSTGSLAPGDVREYHVRVTVPPGTVVGTQETIELTAASNRAPSITDVGTNELTVLDPGYFGPVILLPDHSGIVTQGESIAYTHRIFNNTGAPERFTLTVDVTLGWPTTIHADTNGDGVYTPGVDIAISNTALLPNGGSQILFAVTTAPLSAVAGQREVAHLTARSQSNPVQIDAVTDTTTILAATTHDLAGGGTRLAAVGDTTTFPGTLYNLTGTVDRFDISLTPSSLFGVDGLPHPTVLRVDTNDDGVPDLTIAADLDGDGTWDELCGAPLACSAATYNNNGDGQPDLPVPANDILAYELVRAIDPAQTIWKEYATVTATSFATSERDSITAQWIIAALSRASIRGLRVDRAGLVEFVTGTQSKTGSFNIYGTAERSRDGEKTLLNSAPVISPVPDSLVPIFYRVETPSINYPYLLIEETETNGNVLVYGPYSVVNTRLRRGLERIEAKMNELSVPDGPVRVSRQGKSRIPGKHFRSARLKKIGRGRDANYGLLIEVDGDGRIAVPLSDLVASGFPEGAVASRRPELRSGGVAVPVSIAPEGGVPSLIFEARSISTDYTDRSTYVLTWPGAASHKAAPVPLTSSADPAVPGFTRIERNSIYAASVAQGADPWQWDLLSGDGTLWPYAWWGDPDLGRFDLPSLAGTGAANVPVRIRLVAVTDHKHVISAQINGHSVGSVQFDGTGEALLLGQIPLFALTPEGNNLSLTYSAQNQDGSSAPSGYVYFDYLELSVPLSSGPANASVTSIRPYAPALPALSGVQYLILTHSLFREQADRLAALKTAEKLKAVVIDVETAYDRYAGGVEEPQALVEVIREVARISNKLQYVVLIGDDVLDPRDYLGGAMTSYVPSVISWDGSSRIPNENAFADIDGDGFPDLAVGRLPVSTVEEAQAVIDKIQAQAATLAASGQVHVFTADDSREIDSRFGDEAREMSEKLPLGVTTVLADVGSVGVGLARDALFGTWRGGTTVTHYFGHGGPEIWTDEALFSVDDVPELEGQMSPMVLLAWACQSQFYQNYYGPSINEAMFLLPRGGSVASLGPVGITSPKRQRDLYERVYASLYEKGLSIGEIIRQAKVAALLENPNNKDVIDGFMFLGDPSVRMPELPVIPSPDVPGKGKGKGKGKNE